MLAGKTGEEEEGHSEEPEEAVVHMVGTMQADVDQREVQEEAAGSEEEEAVEPELD